MEQRENLRTLVDWVQFTLPFASDLEQAYDLIGIPKEEFRDMPNGLYGYPNQRASGHIQVLYGAKAEMGIHVQFTGQGCREFETYCGISWPELFYRVLKAGGKFSRIDLAVDEFRYNGEKPYFTLAQLIRKVKRSECRSKFKKAKRIETIHIEGGRSEGQTIYFGSPLSAIQLRCYDKLHERKQAGFDLEEELTTWNRFEIQLADQRALVAAEIVVNGMNAGELIFGVLSNYADFVDRQEDDTNKSRWPRTKWWQDFLNDAAKLRLAVAAPDRTIPEKKRWIEKQVQSSLAELFVALNWDETTIADFIAAGMEKMTVAQWEKAWNFRQWTEDEAEVLKAFKIAKAVELGLIKQKEPPK